MYLISISISGILVPRCQKNRVLVSPLRDPCSLLKMVLLKCPVSFWENHVLFEAFVLLSNEKMYKQLWFLFPKDNLIFVLPRRLIQD